MRVARHILCALPRLLCAARAISELSMGVPPFRIPAVFNSRNHFVCAKITCAHFVCALCSDLSSCLGLGTVTMFTRRARTYNRDAVSFQLYRAMGYCASKMRLEHCLEERSIHYWALCQNQGCFAMVYNITQGMRHLFWALTPILLSL